MTPIGVKINVDNPKSCTVVTKSFSKDWVQEIETIIHLVHYKTIKKKCSYIENNPQRDGQAYKMNGLF